MTKLKRRYIIPHRYISQHPNNQRYQAKVVALILTVIITVTCYDIFSDFLISTTYGLYLHRNSMNCSHCRVGSGGNQVVGKDEKTSILFYTTFLNISEVINNDCCSIKQIVFDSAHYPYLKHDKKLYYQTRLKHLHRVIQPYRVVLFHIRDMPRAQLLKELSPSRPRGQLWAYYSKESPYNTMNLANGKYDDIFNLTITPLRDSDIFAPYGGYKKKVHTSSINNENVHTSSINEEKVHTSSINKETVHTSSRNWFNPHDDIIYRKGVENSKDIKTRLLEQKKLLTMNVDFSEKDLIAWVVSNCDEKRTKYALALSKYIPLHIYGQCGRVFPNTKERICEKDTYKCEERLRKYKFYIAFENSFCDDYVTEKYWNSLVRGSVPVVLGGRNYDEQVVIPGSFINARSFKSAKSLAEHISTVGKNKGLYKKYLRWRDDYVIEFTPNNHHYTDDVVNKLHKLLQGNFFYRSKALKLSKYYGVQRNCPLQINDTLWEY